VITRLKIDDSGRELARIAIEAQPTTAKGKNLYTFKVKFDHS